MQSLLEKAIVFATEKHGGVLRKGKNRPYILHPLEAMLVVSTLCEDPEVLAAAVLHDTVEDAGVTRQELEALFGKRVADLVAGESENKREGQPAQNTWKIRKQETLNHMQRASREEKLICLGDKLSNLREIARDYQEVKDELWTRFNQKDKTQHAWYYGSFLDIFEKEFGEEKPAVQEYQKLLQDVFGKKE